MLEGDLFIKEPRVNEKIRVPEVRVIDANGDQLGIFVTRDALLRAKSMGLDLVEVSPNAVPPVCRLTDYGKYKYQLKKKLQEVKKNQTVIHVKEVKLRPGTEKHDIEHKMNKVKDFLKDGDKAKVSVVFRGREMAYSDQGKEMMEKILSDLGTFAVVEQPPKFEGRVLSMILGPGKIN